MVKSSIFKLCTTKNEIYNKIHISYFVVQYLKILLLTIHQYFIYHIRQG